VAGLIEAGSHGLTVNVRDAIPGILFPEEFEGKIKPLLAGSSK